MAYESKQAILEEAGLSHQTVQETPSGLANGSNTVFTVSRTPMADANYDETIDKDDVTVYVNGAPVTVSSVNATTGAITLAAAPANGATVTVTYRHSPIADAGVTRARQEAEELVDDRLKDLDAPETSPTIRKIVRWYAGGLLLSRDYGFGADTEGTSKDGKKKMETAEKWLESYAKLLEDQQQDDAEEAEIVFEGDESLFTEYDRTTGTYISRDRTFMLGLPDLE